MKSVSLKVYPRTVARRNALKPLRNAGRIPAVVYGAGHPSEALEVDSNELDGILQHHLSETLLVDLSVENDTRPQRLALVQEVQHHPLSRKVVHVDFHEVSANKPVLVSIPVESTGEPVGVKTGGGVLEHVLYKVKVRALPRDLPEAIVVDVSDLDLNRAIHVGELKPPAGVEILGHKELVVFACAAPRTEVEVAAEEAAAEAGTAEVEMIKEKKEEGEEGEEEKAGKAEKAGKGEKAEKTEKTEKPERKGQAKEGQKT